MNINLPSAFQFSVATTPRKGARVDIVIMRSGRTWLKNQCPHTQYQYKQ